MTPLDEKDWDQRFSHGLPSLIVPDPFFLFAYHTYVQADRKGKPGKCLDIAGGLGRHSLWLADRGWDVSIADISSVALTSVKRESQTRGLHLVLHHGDAADLPLSQFQNDLTLLFYHFDRRLFPVIIDQMKARGILILKLRISLSVDPLVVSATTASHEECRTLLAGLHILHSSERALDDSRAVLELVCQKGSTGLAE